ncbi:MAG: hypothetical protein FJZ47_22590 [Candidatus Tectomicrobia bacterium]|uniref:Uncharacterized protein n=1 Tax=Tectimicrobiota bacterium TaxID=2528274 RepID=A0A937W4N3_UNCTE|nr:hypothetical protein [Candidatus Tectomicrobia bacterium]
MRDSVDSAPQCTLHVTSNEPSTGTAPGWRIIDAHHVQLRAESTRARGGRVYTIDVRCIDASSNATQRAVTVRVSPR